MKTDGDVKPASFSWPCIKVLFILFWLSRVVDIYMRYSDTPLPVDIFRVFSFSYTQLPWIRYLFITFALGLSILYAGEINMKVTTLLLFMLSVFSFSFEESNGAMSRSSLLSFIFFAQWA